MSWNVTLYSNTNLTSVNTLLDPAVLSQATTKTVPALDIISGQNLRSVTVKATFADIENVDFIVLQNGTDTYFYAVDGPADPTSTDVWTIPVIMDAWMTGIYKLGGYSNLEILDGVCERHHVTAQEDTFGAYTEPDALLTPSKELELHEVSMFNEVLGGREIIAESLVKLDAAGANNDARVYTDPNTGGTCTLPAPLESEDDPTLVQPSWSNVVEPTEGTAYYDRNNALTMAGLDRVREVGVDQGTILASVKIPSTLVTVTKTGNHGHIDTIVGNQRHATVSALPFEYAQVQNKRLLYGETSAYTLYSTASGQSMQFNPEELYEAGETAPTIYQDIDPRTSGQPIYRFKYFRHVDVITNNLFQNAVYGMEWAQAPLVYTGASGSLLTELRYKAQAEINKTNMDQFNAQLDFQRAQQVRGAGVGVFKQAGAAAMSGAAIGGIGGAIGGAIGASINAGYELWEADQARALQREQYLERYQLNANKELMDLKIATTYVAPVLHFPRNESMRDFLGNGVYITQYRPEASDLAKMDKILTMYGYKDTKVLNKADFNKRAKFSYIKASGVQIGGNLPLWLREAMSAQISAGIRVWKQKPDSTVYTDGSNT